MGEISWPFSQGQFDNFVQRVNKQAKPGSEKDLEVMEAAKRFRRIKELNTARNDYLEYLIFESHQDLIPTFSHKAGIDYYINGIPFDQKVAKSPTNEFIKDFGESWQAAARKNPGTVAKYLYQLQDEGRFGDQNRLYIVQLQDKFTPADIKAAVDLANLSGKPLEINFQYPINKKDKPSYSYSALAYVVLV